MSSDKALQALSCCSLVRYHLALSEPIGPPSSARKPLASHDSFVVQDLHEADLREAMERAFLELHGALIPIE
jgi:hypothetical protein